MADFRPSGFVPPAFTGFTFFDGQAVLVFNDTLDPVTLRRQLSLTLPFIEVRAYFCIYFVRIQLEARGFKMIVRFTKIGQLIQII